jgi:DNA polymerase-3 subunit delta
MTDTPLPPLVLVNGDEELLISRAVADVLGRARALDPEVEIIDVSADAVTPDHILDLGSPSMFSSLKVVVIRDAQDLTEPIREAVISYATAPLPEAVLVVTQRGGRGKRIPDAFTKAGAETVSAAKLTRPAERIQFVVDEGRRHKQRIPGAVAADLVEAVGNDLGELAGAVSLLAEAGKIDAAAVHRYHRGRAETTGFQVADAALGGDVADALMLLRSALDGGTAPVLIASALASGVRDLARVAAAGGGASARQLGMPDWKVRKLVPQVRSWSDAGLAAAVTASAKADEQIKGGGADEVYALERLVLDVSAARRGTAVR